MTGRKSLDLNLFRVFDAVMQQESVAGAARRLEVTPSAISHSLARLRKAFGDPLFAYSEAGMLPTEHARGVYPIVAAALAQLDATIGHKPFDPARSSRVFTVLASHYSSVIVLPPLIRSLTVVAPEVGLIVAPCEPSRVSSDLHEGHATLAIGQFGRLDQAIRRETLFSDDEVVICRRDHPLCHQPVTWAQALGFPRIKIQVSKENEAAEEPKRDRRPDSFSTSRNVSPRGADSTRPRVVVSDDAPISPLLEDTDLVAIGPRRLALRAKGRLAVIEPTDRRFSFKTEMAWHPRVEADDGAAWLIAQFLEGARAQAM